MHLFQPGAALLGRVLGPLPGEVVLEAGEAVGQRGAQLFKAGLVGRGFLRAVAGVLHRQHVLRRADEHLQLLDLVGNGLDDLDAGGADAHHAHTLLTQVQRLVRPAPGVEDAAGKALLPLEHLFHRGRQHAGAGDQVLGVDLLAGVGAHPPAAATVVPLGAGDAGVELDVGPQRQPVGHVVHPALDLGLAGKLRTPGPVGVQAFVKQVLVDVGL